MQGCHIIRYRLYRSVPDLLDQITFGQTACHSRRIHLHLLYKHAFRQPQFLYRFRRYIADVQPHIRPRRLVGEILDQPPDAADAVSAEQVFQAIRLVPVAKDPHHLSAQIDDHAAGIFIALHIRGEQLIGRIPYAYRVPGGSHDAVADGPIPLRASHCHYGVAQHIAAVRCSQRRHTERPSGIRADLRQPYRINAQLRIAVHRFDAQRARIAICKGYTQGLCRFQFGRVRQDQQFITGIRHDHTGGLLRGQVRIVHPIHIRTHAGHRHQALLHLFRERIHLAVQLPVVFQFQGDGLIDDRVSCHHRRFGSRRRFHPVFTGRIARRISAFDILICQAHIFDRRLDHELQRFIIFLRDHLRLHRIILHVLLRQ